MTDVQHDQQSGANNPAEQLLLHLVRHPCDLVDARRLMRCFHASASDMQLALKTFEQLAPPQPEGAEC